MRSQRWGRGEEEVGGKRIVFKRYIRVTVLIIAGETELLKRGKKNRWKKQQKEKDRH